ncbi:ABC transporter ATP-binding protein [Peribacillus loiseleuriae]|uniref:Multidrug ABC transporter ATP-binding protein n=1 Tax=Peribacillus loiseleuriae TaxID=1679170 RepID=A0A0K9GPJ0_9BACI|nr:ABC transporter ATP-binding protein [Peribacillus loiseleuriae]KMY48491.1 multidrug ABC transporter ATP-binding protein [Peribacillus loiseleuriae]
MKRVPPTYHNDQKSKVKLKNWLGTVKRIWSYLETNKTMLFLVLFMVVVSSGLGLLGPYLVGVSVDEFIVMKKSNGLTMMLIGLFIIYVFYSLSTWLQNYWMIGIAQDSVYQMRKQLFWHLHKLPIPFFDRRKHGELMSRVTNDIENVSSTLNSSVIQIFSSVLTLLGTIAVMLWLSPLLTLLTLIIVPIMFYGMRWITGRTGKLFKEQQRNLGSLNGFIEETISGQRIVKTFSQEDKVIEDFIERSKKLKQSGFLAQAYSGFIPKLMNMLNNLSFAIVAGVGGYLALKGQISIGTIVIFTEYSRQFTRPLNDLANQFNTLLSAVAGAERVFEILDEEIEERDENDAEELDDVEGHVTFQSVSFSYDNSRDTVRNVSFGASSGETIAFVGPTGAGKTTLINLLSRFYDPDSGSILVDGHDIRHVKRSSLRRHMGFVLQDSFLFQGTIIENIRYGRLDATDEEVMSAAKQANAHSFIMKLPNQYDTQLLQDGSGISQGQRQLLSIARAILADPIILILDEATSSIDTITELKIQEALQRLMKGRTSFVIAHRLNTIQQADQIFVLQDGEIIEKGSHSSLLQEKGFYYGLYNRQLEDTAN